MCEVKTIASRGVLYCFVAPDGNNDGIVDLIETFAANEASDLHAVTVLRVTPVGVIALVTQKQAYDITSIIASHLGVKVISYQLSFGTVYEAG